MKSYEYKQLPPPTNEELADRIMRLQIIINKTIVEDFVTIHSELDELFDRINALEEKAEDI
jgi:hypothetical protein